jgi:hypothetical protein
MILYLSIATLLGLACLGVVAWVCQPKKRQPDLLWVWRHMRRVV